MDSEKDVNSEPLRKYAKIEIRCNPSKGSRTYNNKVNPFDTVGNYHERRLKEKLQKRNNRKLINIFDPILRNPISESETSNNAQSSQDIRQELVEDVFSSYPYIRESPVIYNRSDKSISQPAVNLPTNRSEDPHTSAFARNVPTRTSPNNRQSGYDNKNGYATRSYINKPDRMDKNTYPEKVTQYSPAQNMVNEEFVINTMQRHARLQKLVRKLVIERQKEKQRETWNNYINELKNKHRYYSNEPTRIVPQYVPNDEESIDDFWDARYSYQQNNTQSRLKDFSKNTENYQPGKYVTLPFPGSAQYYGRNAYCYPTSSQGRLLMLNRERERINSIPRPFHKHKFIEVERRLKTQRNDNAQLKENRTFSNIQTDLKFYSTQGVITQEKNKDCNKIDTFRRILSKRISKMTTLKEQILQTDNLIKVPLESIEQKLDILIKSVKSVQLGIEEQKDKNVMKHPITKSRSTLCTLRVLSELALNRTKSESYKFKKDNDILYTTVLQKNERTVALSEIGTSTPQFKEANENKIEKIIQEEKEKSDKIRKDIEELLQMKCKRQCSVDIGFDIPTREISTVATKSLLKTQHCTGQEQLIRSRDEENKQITIAVNTDPLGLCALLQVSGETIRHLLAYMLNLNYDSYLSVLQQRRHPCVTNYICNICGEKFSSPSQLSEHIENHYFGRRNCCVCRHVLNLRSDKIGLFSCKYCGQTFTRAYCCELHQEACAKHYGRKHDVQSNLMILR